MDVFDVARYFGALLVTLALMGVALWAARRFLPSFGATVRQAPKRLRVTASLNLDPRRRLIVVRWDDREHLLLLGAAERVVADAPAREDGETADRQRAGFAAALTRAQDDGA